MRHLLAVLVFVCLGFAVQARAAPLEAYGRLPNIEDIALSPDGDHVALVVTDGEQRRVVITRLRAPQPMAILDAGDRKLRSIAWAGNNHVLFTITTTTTPRDVMGPRAEYAVTSNYDIARRSQRMLIRGITNVMNVTAGGPYVRTVDGRTFAIVIGLEFPAGGGRSFLSVFRTDPNSRATAITDHGSYDVEDWAFDEQGRAVSNLRVAEQSGRWRVWLRPVGAGWRIASEGPDYNRAPGLGGLGRDGQSVLVFGNEGSRQTIREVSLATGAWSEPIGGDEEPVDVLVNPVTFRLSGLRYLLGDTYRTVYYDPAEQRTWEAVQNAYPGQTVDIVSTSANQRRLIVYVDSPTEGPAYALVDFDTGRATWIGNAYTALREQDISPVRYITYRAEDGLEIGAYLTLPRGRDPRNLPLVVLPHGGPESRDTRGFDWWAQALASRGYAVLQPNFRGSSGYGYAFVQAGFGQWGRKMQTDLSDGVRHLAREHIIDPARVCIVGASYGGYAALAGVTLQRGIYRCAASVGGVADPVALISYGQNRQGEGVVRYWNEFMGVQENRNRDLAPISPQVHAADASAPILLIHGRDDTVVPFTQSSRMAATLRAANRPVELVALDGEDHWLSRGDTRLQMLTAVVRFLETNNPPDPAPAPPAPAAAAP